MSVRYREWPAHPALRPWVRCFWVLEHPAGFGEPERVLPDGTAEWVVHYGDRFVQYDDTGSPRRLQPRSLLVAGQRRFLMIEPIGAAGMIGVRFAPGAIGRFLDDPVDRLGDPVADVEALWGAEARELEERVGEAVDDAGRGRLLETFLLRRLDAGRRRDALVEHALVAITATRGAVRVGALAQDARVSRRTFERRFRAEVGVTAKDQCRIVRFQRVLTSLQAGDRGWADVAAHVGFADQAHLTRDFREIAGLPPEAFRRERHAYADLFVAGG